MPSSHASHEGKRARSTGRCGIPRVTTAYVECDPSVQRSRFARGQTRTVVEGLFQLRGCRQQRQRTTGSFQFNNPCERVKLARFLHMKVLLSSMVRKGLLERRLTEPDFNNYRSTKTMGLRVACFSPTCTVKCYAQKRIQWNVTMERMNFR